MAAEGSPAASQLSEAASPVAAERAAQVAADADSAERAAQVAADAEFAKRVAAEFESEPTDQPIPAIVLTDGEEDGQPTPAAVVEFDDEHADKEDGQQTPAADIADDEDEDAKSGQSAARTPLEASSALGQATLDDMEGTPYCSKCSFPIAEIFRAKLYGKQQGVPSFICRHCNCCMTMVAKNMDLKQLEASGLSFGSLQGTKSGDEFFRQARDTADEHGRLNWNQVRELLASALTERRLQVTKVKYTDKEFPLSVWVRKGFDEQEILKNGKKVPHPTFSNVYKAPLKTSSREDVMHP